MAKSISYVIAGFNEEKIIESAVTECLHFLNGSFIDYELILVNDASTDNTGFIMDRLSAQYPYIHVLHNYINLNFGASVLRGLVYASKEIVLYNAADLPLSPSITSELVDEIDDYDVLVLQRVNYRSTGWRKLTSSINTVLLNILYPRLIKGTPVLNFVQVFKKDVIKDIIPFARSPIFVWPEMVFRAKLKGLKVKNRITPMRDSQIRKGSFGKPHDIIWGIYDMCRFRLRCWQKKL